MSLAQTIPTHSVAAMTLRRERDALQSRMLRECEDLLKHDEEVNVLKLKLGRAEQYRKTINRILSDLSTDSKALEESYRQMTGKDMPAPPAPQG